MDRTLKNIDIACNSVGRLFDSIKMMEQLKKNTAFVGSVPARQQLYQTTQVAQRMNETAAPQRPVRVFNDKTENQAVIERRLVG